jgi:hypothetical protein
LTLVQFEDRQAQEFWLLFEEGLHVVERVRLDERARLRKKIGSYRDDGQEYNVRFPELDDQSFVLFLLGFQS